MKRIKEEQVKKVFGDDETKSYRIKRNWFFIIVFLVFIIVFFFRRYFNFITDLRHLFVVNVASLLGLLVGISLFYLASISFNVNFKKRHYFFAYFMSIVGITLSSLYYKFPHYDKIQHFFFPMMFASMALFIISKKLNLSRFWRLLFTFFIIVGLLSIFEVLEYFLDYLFNWKLQGVFIIESGNYAEVLARIDDTMIDIALGALGTLIYIFSVAWIEKRKLKQKH